MDAMWHETGDSFLRAAGAPLEAEEALNNLILGLAVGIAAGRPADRAPPVMITVGEGDSLDVAALMTTPPQYVLLYTPGDPLPEAMCLVADALLDHGVEVRGCMAPIAAAEAFVGLWSERTGREATLSVSMRIHELRSAPPSAQVSGRLRAATLDDLEVVARWRHLFNVEALGEDDADGTRAATERNIEAGQLFLWEDAGRPVSQAVATRPTRRGISIGAVFTPAELRGRGYATACVTELSRRQLAAGREFCSLHTDLANPTSNSIYRKIGYVPVADTSRYSFEG